MLQPPPVERKPHQLTAHEETRVDHYYWLRERDNPDVIAYLEAENHYTKIALAHTEVLQKRLYAEMRGRIQEADLDVPTQLDDYFYYVRTEEGQQYPIYCRRLGSMEAAEEALLDQNGLAEGHGYTRLGGFCVSPDHRLLAYTVDHDGNELYTLHVKNLTTGETLPDRVTNTYYGLEWGNDNRTLFYTTSDEAKRPYRVHRHRLGSAPEDDVVIFEEKDERFFVTVSKSKSQRYLFLRLRSATTNEVWQIPADKPKTAPQVILPRRQGIEYHVEHHGEFFYLTTNDQALDFRVLVTPVDAPGINNWREVVPHEPGVKLDRIEPFADFIVLHHRRDGLKQLRIFTVNDDSVLGADHPIDFPEPVYAISPNANPDFNSRLLRFTYASLTMPDTVYDYDMVKRTRLLKKRKPILGGYDPADYVAERHWAEAADGARVPISLVYRQGLRRDGKNPTLLYGYGSYGYTVEPSFDANRLSLLDRGFVFAIAHIRGSGAMGRAWYEHGKLRHKRNTFSDFIAAAEHLIEVGFTQAERLVITGSSAGGLLMGAVTNMRPDLFAAVIALVPFVDVISTMSDPSIPLTVTEYEEWGNPADVEDYAYMKSYSPYDNVEAKEYPPLLITAGLNDPRVQYWEPAKWAAALRARKTDDNRLLLKTNMDAGHGGASGRFDYLEEVALRYAFALDMVGITE